MCAGSGLISGQGRSAAHRKTKPNFRSRHTKRDALITAQNHDPKKAPPQNNIWFKGTFGTSRGQDLKKGHSYFANHRRQPAYAYITNNYKDLRSRPLADREARDCVASWMMSVDRQNPCTKTYFVFAKAIKHIIDTSKSWPRCLGDRKDLGLLRDYIDLLPNDGRFSSDFKGSSPKKLLKDFDYFILLVVDGRPLIGG